MRTLKDAIDIIKEAEGLRLKVYLCPRGLKTVGYGHRTDLPLDYTIREEEAEMLLGLDIRTCEIILDHRLEKENLIINDNQYSALISLLYNSGAKDFFGSRLWANCLKKNFQEASKEFDDWVHVNGKVLEGLVKRRKAEKALFLK